MTKIKRVEIHGQSKALKSLTSAFTQATIKRADSEHGHKVVFVLRKGN